MLDLNNFICDLYSVAVTDQKPCHITLSNIFNPHYHVHIISTKGSIQRKYATFEMDNLYFVCS